MTFLVSLISAHLLPNYLLAKEMEGKYDAHLFITTEKMNDSQVGMRLEKVLGVPDHSIRRIEVCEEDLNHLLQKLEAEPFSKDDRFIVNITCGTKIMSLGVFTFFSRFDSSFFYLPMGKNKIENVQNSDDIPIHYQISIKEYLTLYGLTHTSEEHLTFSAEHTFYLFERYKKTRFNRHKIPEIKNAHFLHEDFAKRYYSGAWFEEYVYLKIKEEKHLSNDSIAWGVKLYRKDSGMSNDNEIDIMFIINNQLHIGECKISLMKAPGTSASKTLEDYLYKLAAISKDLGTNVIPYIFTLHDFSRFSPQALNAIHKRQQILGIKEILHRKNFYQNKLIK